MKKNFTIADVNADFMAKSVSTLRNAVAEYYDGCILKCDKSEKLARTLSRQSETLDNLKADLDAIADGSYVGKDSKDEIIAMIDKTTANIRTAKADAKAFSQTQNLREAVAQNLCAPLYEAYCKRYESRDAWTLSIAEWLGENGLADADGKVSRTLVETIDFALGDSANSRKKTLDTQTLLSNMTAKSFANTLCKKLADTMSAKGAIKLGDNTIELISERKARIAKEKAEREARKNAQKNNK